MADSSLDLGELCVDKGAVPVALSVVFDQDLKGFFITIAGDEPSVRPALINMSMCD